MQPYYLCSQIIKFIHKMSDNVNLGQFMFVNQALLTETMEEVVTRMLAPQVKNKVKDAEAETSHPLFLTRAETAEMLKVDFTTLWRWNKSGFLRAIKVGVRKVMYKYEDVISVLEGKK